MNRPAVARRVALPLAMALALSLGFALAREDATGGEAGASGTGPFPDGITVVGDSITALYNDEPGHERQGWWSFVGRHFDAEVTTYAQSGSGYLRPGDSCTGNRFIDRASAWEDPPSVFLIEGGRNDWATCQQGDLVQSGDAAVAAAVNEYFATVQSALPDTTRIVVLGPPWGHLSPWEMRRITSIVHTAADRNGLEYIGTRGTIEARDRTTDGVHPNRAGSRVLGERVIAGLSDGLTAQAG